MTQIKFGRLTVVDWNCRVGKEIFKSKKGNEISRNSYFVLCQCDCGNNVEVKRGNLFSGNTSSCGCYQKDQVSNSKKTHGMSDTKLYGVWLDMKNRCYNSNRHNYKNYGGRGIKVCDEWLLDSSVFLKWAIDNGYKEGLCIERSDNNGNYEPLNCKWITFGEQQSNTTRSRKLTAFGETKNLEAWKRDPRCKVAGITLARRVKKNWDFEKALTLVQDTRFKKKGEVL